MQRGMPSTLACLSHLWMEYLEDQKVNCTLFQQLLEQRDGERVVTVIVTFVKQLRLAVLWVQSSVSN